MCGSDFAFASDLFLGDGIVRGRLSFYRLMYFLSIVVFWSVWGVRVDIYGPPVN